MQSVARNSPGGASSSENAAAVVDGAMMTAAVAATTATTTDGVRGSSEPIMLLPSSMAASQKQKNKKRQGTTEPANEDKEEEHEPKPPPPKAKRPKKKSVGVVVDPVKGDVQKILDRLVGPDSTDKTQIEAMATLARHLFDGVRPDMSTSEALTLVLMVLRQRLDKCESSSSDDNNILAPPRVVVHAIDFLYWWMHHFDTPRNDDMTTFGGASTVVRAMIDYPHDRRLQASCAQALYLFTEGRLGTIPAWEEVRQRRYRVLVEAGAVLPTFRFLVTTFSDPNEDSEFKWEVRKLFDGMCDDATINDVDALNAVGAVFFLANVWNWYQQNHRQRLIATAGCQKWIHKLTAPS